MLCDFLDFEFVGADYFGHDRRGPIRDSPLDSIEVYRGAGFGVSTSNRRPCSRMRSGCSSASRSTSAANTFRKRVAHGSWSLRK
jgi:hypothetical protein